MCDSCFNVEIKSFDSQNDFESFDLSLTKKLANEKTMKHVKFVTTSEIQIDNRDYEKVGYTVYKCLKCGQLWGLRDPDQADRGFFMRLTPKGIIKDQSVYNKGKDQEWYIIVAIIIALLLYFLSRN